MFQYRDLKFFINRKEKKKIKKTPKIFSILYPPLAFRINFLRNKKKKKEKDAGKDPLRENPWDWAGVLLNRG